MPRITLDTEAAPEQQYRIDSFVVPDAVRAEFESTMRRNLAFLSTLPGFLGHVVFEKAGGPGAFNVVTLAAWESRAALDAARAKVAAYYQELGFDPARSMARWGVKAELGRYQCSSGATAG